MEVLKIMKTITIYNGKKAINEILRETIKLNCSLDSNINYKAVCGRSKARNITRLYIYKVGSKSLLYCINLVHGTIEQYQRKKLINKTSLQLFKDYDFYIINEIKPKEPANND